MSVDKQLQEELCIPREGGIQAPQGLEACKYTRVLLPSLLAGSMALLPCWIDFLSPVVLDRPYLQSKQRAPILFWRDEYL